MLEMAQDLGIKLHGFQKSIDIHQVVFLLAALGTGFRSYRIHGLDTGLN